MNWLKMLFCKHKSQKYEIHAIVNGGTLSVRRMLICGKCEATSAMTKRMGTYDKPTNQ